MVYGQTELTRDLYEARDRMNGIVIHSAEDVQPHDLKSDKPYVTYTVGGEAKRVDCDFIIGADGFHGVSRKSIPSDVIKEYEKVYPFGWLGILSQTPPAHEELIYANHQRGFALAKRVEHHAGGGDGGDGVDDILAGILGGAAAHRLEHRRALRVQIAARSHAEATLYRLEAEWEAARLLCYKAATMKDAGERVTTASAMAKLYASEAASRICNRRNCSCRR